MSDLQNLARNATPFGRLIDRLEHGLFAGLEVKPWYSGPIGWRWRIVLAARALQGRELRGWLSTVHTSDHGREASR